MNPKALYIAGEFIHTDEYLSVKNPYSNEEIAQVSVAHEKDLFAAIEAAQTIRSTYQKWTGLQVSHALLKIADRMNDFSEEFTQTIISESAKPYRYAKGEVLRAVETFRMAAFASTKLPHELIALDTAASGAGLMGRVQYASSGIVAGISPFNFPLNLVAHKVAPAIATRSPIILKPSSKTPLTALLLAKIIHECGLPDGAFSVLPCSRKVGDILVEDSRVQVLSFTGSPEVGWSMKERSGKKKVVLELGGNAAAIVHQDAELKAAIEQCFIGALAYSGQVCIHTQRIYVHRNLYASFLEEFVTKASSLRCQDPALHSCEFSVMIDESNATRVESWIEEAQNAGANLLFGGKRNGNFVEPTIFSKTSRGMKIHDEEVFGPVVCINPYDHIDEAIEQVNDSRFGLQAAIFSNSQKIIEQCYAQLEVGAVIANKATTFRTDQMPYGGVKDSGFGREGVEYAMMDYLEPKLLVF